MGCVAGRSHATARRSGHASSFGRAICGATFIELILFIVIASIVATAMVQVFSATMSGSYYGKELTQAMELAQQRGEVILGQRRRLGFASFSASTFDPCDAVGPAAWATAACTSTSGYTVTTTLTTTTDICGTGTGTDCKHVTVSVTGPRGDALSTLTYQVWGY